MKNDEVFVFGHKNPDTDSICSSIAYSAYKRKRGLNANPYRLGKINEETKFVLDYFNVPVPPLLEDVKIKISDLSFYVPMKFLKSDPIKYAWDFTRKNYSSRLIPVLDDKNHMEGILTIGDITEIFMAQASADNSKITHEILFKNLLYILKGNHVYGQYNYEKINGHIYVDSSALDLKDRINDNDIAITARLETAKIISEETNCGCIILANGEKPIGLENSKSAIVTVEKNVYNSIAIINQAISIGSVMRTKEILSFQTDNYMEDVMEIMKSSTHRNYPVINKSGEFVGVVSRRHLLDYNEKQVILVDHNEKSQSVDGLEQAKILEIVDHHRVADIQTESPLYIRAEPVGCTSTIIYKMHLENRITIDKAIAGLMLSAILSDTLSFSSPTCTEEDKIAATNLAVIAEINIDKYSRDMFNAGSSLEGYTPNEILAMDLKQFTFGKYLFAISQVTTLDFRSISNLKDDLLLAMEQYSDKYSIDMVILMITDVVSSGSEILVSGVPRAKDIVEKAFGLKKDENSIYLDKVVSRKKQMVPRLTIASQTI